MIDYIMGNIDKAKVNNLRNNAVFQLSLSSKELFHSNFLYWMATDVNLGNEFFPNLMASAFGFDLLKEDSNWRTNYLFFREYENFDFCIRKRLGDSSGLNDKDSDSGDAVGRGDLEADEETFECSLDVPKEQWGRIVFVLENIFKSLPRTDQLKEYSQKIGNINCKFLKQQTCTRDAPKQVLLTLARPYFLDENKNKWEEWDIVRYNGYANCICDVLNQIKDEFRQQLLIQYQMFISTYSDSVASVIGQIGKSDGIVGFLDAFKNNPFTGLRVDDIWQKLVADKIDHIIAEKFCTKYSLFHDNEKEFESCGDHYKILHGSSFSNSTGIISYVVPLDDMTKPYYFAFTIQLQAGQYRRCLEYRKNESSSQKGNIENENFNDGLNRLENTVREKFPFTKSLIKYPNIETNITFNNPFKSNSIYPTYDNKSKRGAKNRGFCKFGKNFVYQYWKIEEVENGDCTIECVAQQVFNDINLVLEKTNESH